MAKLACGCYWNCQQGGHHPKCCKGSSSPPSVFFLPISDPLGPAPCLWGEQAGSHPGWAPHVSTRGKGRREKVLMHMCLRPPPRQIVNVASGLCWPDWTGHPVAAPPQSLPQTLTKNQAWPQQGKEKGTFSAMVYVRVVFIFLLSSVSSYVQILAFPQVPREARLSSELYSPVVNLE